MDEKEFNSLVRILEAYLTSEEGQKMLQKIVEGVMKKVEKEATN